MNAPEEDKLVIDLREESLSAQQVAWGRTDGGQDYALAAQLADAAADRIVEQAARLAALEAEKAKAEALLAEAVEALRALRDSLQSVIQHSEGVAGLHRNGDVAPWETLFASGAYEDWFGTSFDDASATLAKIKEVKNG